MVFEVVTAFAWYKKNNHQKDILVAQIPDLYMNRARTLACVRRFKEAILDYQSALNLDPESGEAYTNLGNAYLALGNNTEALRCHKKAIVLSPNVAGVWVTSPIS
jgi:tetratricopeptide (TPR) repeat protein